MARQFRMLRKGSSLCHESETIKSFLDMYKPGSELRKSGAPFLFCQKLPIAGQGEFAASRALGRPGGRLENSGPWQPDDTDSGAPGPFGLVSCKKILAVFDHGH